MTATTVPELMAACWTTAGNVRPFRTAEESPVPIERRVGAAAAAGYVGFGLRHEDLVVARERLGLSGMRDLFAEYGMRYIQLEFLDHWWADGPKRTASDRVREDLLEAAQTFAVHHIKVGVGDEGDSLEPDRVRQAFATLAADCAGAGTRAAIEAVPFSAIPKLEDAAALVRDVGHRGGGLLLDDWHLFRSGLPYSHIPEVVPAGSVFAVELDDGHAAPVGTLFDDTFDNRLLCGEGDFDVVEFIRQIDAIGYDGPWGVEMMSEHHRRLEPEVATEQAFAAAMRCLKAAGIAGA